MSAKEDLDHILTTKIVLPYKDRIHAGINECLRKHFQMFMINIESIDCDRLFGSLSLHENKLRKLNF